MPVVEKAGVTGRWLRLLIALDVAVQVPWRYGKPGVTVSSRIGTAAAHRHRWGLAMFWVLDHTPWLGFGRDKVTGESHCIAALRNDVLRARQAEAEILGDPVVVEFANLQDMLR